MLAHRERRLFTPEEYLTLEEGASFRSEFYRGEIFAMSGGSVEHNRLVKNLFRLIDPTLDGKGCELFLTDLRLRVERHDLFTYPDLFVVCGPILRMEGRTDTIRDATLVIEILSRKTELYDRGEKFLLYKGLPSFREYVLVSQKEQKVERHVRTARKEWRSAEYGEGESFSLKSIGCELSVEAIYRGIHNTDKG